MRAALVVSRGHAISESEPDADAVGPEMRSAPQGIPVAHDSRIVRKDMPKFR